ncbi:MAG TPA: hypothetical protein DCX07_00555 [Phycisphaerales bacterium]|nr:hypothetical protein [Phycisphaerales bacterium]
MSMPSIQDVAILGANCSGLAAAVLLAGRKRSVLVVEAPAAATECPLCDWAPADFFRAAGLGKNLFRACGAQSFRKVVYHDATLRKRAEHSSRAALGAFVDAGELGAALRSAAKKAGARFRAADASPVLRPDEEQVRLVFGEAHVTAKFLLISQGRPRDVLNDLSLPARAAPQSRVTAAALDVPISAKDLPRDAAGALHVVEMPDRSEIGMYFVHGKTLHIRVISTSAASGSRAAELSGLVGSLQEAQLLPTRLALGKARGAVWHPPAGLALELDSHVAKRCLLAGTAGGFAASITAQTLLPTVQSALLAAEAADQALDSPTPQETLMQFKNSWRKSLADLLRPPSTSPRMLLPLLFVNNNLVERFTRAMLYGEEL